MEAVIFVGLQAAGKSTFYLDRFFHTHVRINLDQLKTRHREWEFLTTCLRTKTRFVIDNTNPASTDREPYIAAAKAAGFQVICYFFESKAKACMARNAARSPEQQVPVAGILGTQAKLQIPQRSEGYDEMWFVRLMTPQGFTVEAWRDEV